MTPRELLFRLIRIALDKDEDKLPLSDVPLSVWSDALDLAGGLGVLGLCAEGVQRVPEDQLPSGHYFDPWLGHVVHLHYDYSKRWKVACKLADLWAKEGIKTTVLKGFAFAQYYPMPKHRYSCDLDLYIADGWERACEVLEEMGVALERKIYKDVSFQYEGVHVECHRVIRPVRGNAHEQQVDRYLRSMLPDGFACRDEDNLLFPSLQFNVTLFINHALGDLLNSSLSFKQLLDWIVLREQSRIDWGELKSKCQEFRCERFVNLLNALADVVIGKSSSAALPQSYCDVFDEMFSAHQGENGSLTKRRWQQFFHVISNYRRFQHFGYCSMPSYLIPVVWAHFFRKVKFD